MKKIGPLLLILLLSGCVEEPGNGRPWTGYAWNFKEKRLEWFFTEYETLRDCKESMAAQVAPGAGNSEWYSKPIGCGYHGNEYWRVWMMNALFGGGHLGCIRRYTSESAQKVSNQFAPLLEGFPTAAEPDSYCM